MARIKYPKRLYVTKDDTTYFGFDQAWYPSLWRRKVGCAPACATMQIIYLNQRNKLNLPYSNESYNRLIDCMNAIWSYVTPGLRGVSSLNQYEAGVLKMAENYGVRLKSRKLEVDMKKPPDHTKVLNFIQAAINADTPVAFFNRHNADMRGLDHWHWVIIVAIEGSIIVCYDKGKRIKLDIREWLKHTAKGGGFIYFSQPIIRTKIAAKAAIFIIYK